MPKWDFLRERFPILGDEPRYHEALVAQIRAYEPEDIAWLTAHYNECETLLADLDVKARDTKLKLEAVLRVLADKMELTGLDSIVASGYRWTPTLDVRPSVTDREALREWARAHMPDNLQLPSSTLTNVVKDALADDTGTTKLPPGVDVFLKRSFRRTKQS
jgi:hypothetical protein